MAIAEASDTATTEETTTPNIPETLSTGNSKLVYHYLAVHGETTVEKLHKELHMKRLTLFSILKTLQSGDHIHQNGQHYQIAN